MSGALSVSSIKSESGYALASMLMLVTILTCVAGSILLLQFLERKQVLSDVARVKAMYAAESGIAQVLASCRTSSDLGTLAGTSQHLDFSDGAQARVELTPWGVFFLVESEGRFRATTSTRRCLIAGHPPEAFQHALFFANPNHQLVLAGSSSITGNVLLGQPGATTGSLRGRRSPPRLPITGRVQKEPSPSLPPFGSDILQAQFDRASSHTGSYVIVSSGGTIDLTGVPDSALAISIQGDASLTGRVIRREKPLWIFVEGDVLIGSGVTMLGLVAVRSSGNVRVEGHVSMEHVLVMSEGSIQLGGTGDIIAQFIAPLVRADSGTTLRYPSAVVSIPVRPGRSQEISVRGGATIEGIVAMTGDGAHTGRNVTIEQSAVVIGGVYSSGGMTMDGTVIGSVLTREFAFYEAPTQYLGWLRSGFINRLGLPDSYLTPPGFSQDMRLDILDWL